VDQKEDVAQLHVTLLQSRFTNNKLQEIDLREPLIQLEVQSLIGGLVEAVSTVFGRGIGKVMYTSIQV